MLSTGLSKVLLRRGVRHGAERCRLRRSPRTTLTL
jgi:hypothetical protein